MANEFNAKGRRMVFEEDIEKIGQGGGSEYTAGNGINITNNEISVDETEIQGKLTAGSGISIENDVISATGGSGASFTDWLDFGDSERYTITADEYNQLKNGEKRLRYRGAIYEVTQIVLEPDWSGFTGLILEISAPGINKIDTYGQGQAKVGKFHIGINGPDSQNPYAVSYNQDPLVAANTGETPDYTLSTLRVGDNIYSVGGGSSETVYGSKELVEDSWDNLVQAGMPVLTSETMADGTEFIIDGVVGIEYQQNKVVLYNATSHANAFSTHKFGQPIRMRKTNSSSYKIVDGYLNTVISTSTLTDVTEEHAFTNSEGSQITYQINAAGALFNPVFATIQRDTIALNTRYLDASVTERKVHTMLDIPRTTAGDYVLSCSTDGSNITEFGWKTPQGGGTTVSGTNDGTNWTSLTVGSDTYAVPQPEPLYAHEIRFNVSDTTDTAEGNTRILTSDSTPFTLSSLGTYLYNKGFMNPSTNTLLANGVATEDFGGNPVNAIILGIFSYGGNPQIYAKTIDGSQTIQPTISSIADKVVTVTP